MFLFLLIAVASASRAQDKQADTGSFLTIGYLPDYRMSDWDTIGAKYLTDLILFSAEPTADGDLNMTRLESCPWDRMAAVRKKHSVRLILSIGGWERSHHFAAMSQSSHRRARFADRLVALAKEKGIDGFDLDWEHPQSESEQTQYGLLLRDLREQFDPVGLTLSLTMAGWQSLPQAAFEAVHRIQLMAYDHEGEHATMDNVQREVLSLLERGVPRHKLVLGLPFYGRDVHNREATTYAEILRKHAPAPDIDRIGDLYFNGRRTIARKVQFAREQSLAGVMVWEVGQDASGESSLLRTIDGAKRRSGGKKIDK